MRGVHRSARSEVGLVGTGPSPLSCVTAGPTSGPSAITPAGGGLGLLSENQVFVAGRRAGRCVSESSKWQLTPGWPVWTQPLKGQGREPGARQELWAHQSGENWVPPKGTPKSYGLELTKVTSLGRRVFAGVIVLRVWRCRHRARGWPACSDWSHVREERAWGAEPQGERPRDDRGEAPTRGFGLPSSRGCESHRYSRSPSGIQMQGQEHAGDSGGHGARGPLARRALGPALGLAAPPSEPTRAVVPVPGTAHRRRPPRLRVLPGNRRAHAPRRTPSRPFVAETGCPSARTPVLASAAASGERAEADARRCWTPVPVPGEAALLPPWAGTRAPQRPAEPRPRQGGPARLPGPPQTGLLTHSPVWALSPLLSPRRPHPEVLGPLQVSRAGSPPPHPRPGRQPDALFAGGRASPSATSWGAGGSGALCSE